MSTQTDFLATLQYYYDQHARHDLPWRLPDADGSFNPYKIVVSEFMLQQTQVSRVIPKYLAFLERFPTAADLASSSLDQVLRAWAGLGYNRRARYLHEAVRQLLTKKEPWTCDDLVACKGVGPNTAAAVLVYSYNLPVVFIETNIRTVIMHHFFEGKENIADREILEQLEKISKQAFLLQNPREFYWAMMDYGTYLKASVGRINYRSKSYTKQSVFKGSRREVRGKIIALLLNGPRECKQVRQTVNDTRFDEVVATLQDEKLVNMQGSVLMLYNKLEEKHKH